ncbi:blue copper protein-like [Vitis riparia]|uniref:blue copper protein-like n=1 Tax=Vitis riparia TaxID=96939 RepID=UPI00155ADB7C|nr:blue copper protein-like [Vitis riparia]
MEQRMLRSGSAFLLLPLLLLLVFVSFSGCVEAYKNYTVGDSLGWYDNLHEPSVNYQKWVAGKNFSLGDFLIFNTDNNHSVVQTYNFTTYKHCDYENALENDTYQWSATDPSATNPVAVTVAVPLMKEGMTYFFSSDYDGWQCKHGQHFKLNVSHGQGLPPSLKDPADEAPGPVAPDSGDEGDSAPDTVVPANFNDPKQENDTDNTSGSAPLLPSFLHQLDYKFSGILALLGVVCIF